MALASISSQGQQLTKTSSQTHVQIQILPFARLDFLDAPLLALDIPPPTSTIPSAGVRFLVTGNALASVSAMPDEFIWVPSQTSFMGKAILNGDVIGYNIEVRFPRTGVAGSPVQIAGLPGYEPSGTAPLSVNLSLTLGQREGVVHLEASQKWTPDGAFPLPGVYVGHITLTLTAENV